MQYISTRGYDTAPDAAAAIRNGIARDGGLYVPAYIPKFNAQELVALSDMDYRSTAALVFRKYLSGYTDDDIEQCIRAAYTGTFEQDEIAPLHRLDAATSVMELWHGPTSAFKDVALQMLPQLAIRALRPTNPGSRIAILVATSGDTGKAALEGFRDVEGASVTVLFPCDGVSDMQRLQMQTQRGSNVAVLAVEGNFDDAQAAAKGIFADTAFRSALEDKGVLLSSANSINWGRLLPQIVYYVYAAVRQTNTTDFVIPTGNFGNILACWYAKRMGAPIGTLVCASNANDVLTDFLHTGTYDRRRTFHQTLSPSMDILVSSNLERLLFELSGRSDSAVRGWMSELQSIGHYQVPPALLGALQTEFMAYTCDDADTIRHISSVYKRWRYVVDPHTAVACSALEKYRSVSAHSPAIVVSTASPYKFPFAVYEAVTGEKPADTDVFTCVKALAALTGTAVPRGIAELETLPRLHTDVCGREDILASAKHKILSLC